MTEWKDKWVQVEKASPSVDADFPTPNQVAYAYGKENKGTSIPTGYTILGKVWGEPALDQTLCIVRYERNGEPALGVFQTSVIQELEELVQEDGSILLTIRTGNSVYWVTESDEAERKYEDVHLLTAH